jgi:hypothetical protein
VGWIKIPAVTLMAAYFAGVIVGLWRTDAPAAQRLGLALLWPVAAVACVITLSILSVSAAVLFPMIGVAALVVGIGWMVFA